jgi:hypothetical protein
MDLLACSCEKQVCASRKKEMRLPENTAYDPAGAGSALKATPVVAVHTKAGPHVALPVPKKITMTPDEAYRLRAMKNVLRSGKSGEQSTS